MLRIEEVNGYWYLDYKGVILDVLDTPAKARFRKRQFFYYLNDPDQTKAIRHLEKEMPPKRKECPCCGSMVLHVRKWRTNTRFVDDTLNYQESCYDCIVENDLVRHHDWCEYYSMTYGYLRHAEFIPRSRKDYVK